MTTINVGTGDIPSNINTLERLILWGGLLASTINPTLSANEVPNAAGERMFQFGIFTDASNVERALVRASIPIDSAYRSDNSKKLWMFANEASNIVVPASYKSN